MADVNLKDLTSKRRMVSEATAALFGQVDSNDSFWLQPPDSVTRCEVLVMDSAASAVALATRLLEELDVIQIHRQVVVLRAADAKLYNPIIQRGEAREIFVIHRAESDSRGSTLDNWSDNELRLYVTQNGIAKSAKGIERDDLVTMIRDDYYGRTGGGASMPSEDDDGVIEGEVTARTEVVRTPRGRKAAAEPAKPTKPARAAAPVEEAAPARRARKPADKIGQRLAKIYDALLESPALRGKAKEAKALRQKLDEHREGLFETGRKTRIGEMRALLKLTAVDDDRYDGMNAALSDVVKQL